MLWPNPCLFILTPPLLDVAGAIIYVNTKSVCWIIWTRRVCETQMPPAATKSKYGKISKSQILTPPQTPGSCDVSEVWGTLWWSYSPSLILYDHPNFKYCTLFASGTELQTDDPITRCPRRTFQAGGIKTIAFSI